MRVLHLFISPGHNYFGRHEQAQGDHPLLEVRQIECVAGKGIRGDRFFDFKPNYKGQITFFASEDLQQLWEQPSSRDPGATRRNVITAGMELPSLISAEFEIQGVRFLGVEECRPCHWMNAAIHPEAEVWMRGRGGLRAKILTDGFLQSEEPLSDRSDATHGPAALPTCE